MTAIGGGDGDALVPYSLETTIDVEVGWGGWLNGGIVASRYRCVCGICPSGLVGKEKMNQLDLWAQKKGTDTKYS